MKEKGGSEMDLWNMEHAVTSAKNVMNHLNSQITDDHIALISEEDPGKYSDTFYRIQDRLNQLEEAMLTWRRFVAELQEFKQNIAPDESEKTLEVIPTPKPVEDKEIYF